MPKVLSQLFKAHYASACCVGVLAGLALAVPAGSSDWSSSLMAQRSQARLESDPLGDLTSLPFEYSYGLETPGLLANLERDYGGFILGGSLHTGLSEDPTQIHAHDASRLVRLSAGYDFGRTRGYVTIGDIQHGTGSQETRGQLYGIGVRVSVNRALQMAGEIVHQVSGGAAGVQGGEEDVLSIRAAFRF